MTSNEGIGIVVDPTPNEVVAIPLDQVDKDGVGDGTVSTNQYQNTKASDATVITTPSIAITSPTASQRCNASKTVSFTESEANAPKLSIDGSVWVTAVSGATTLNDITGFGALGQGAFTLYLKDTDNAGNPLQVTRSVIKDTVASTVNILSPVASDQVKGTKIVTFTTSENVAPKLSIDNVTFVAATSGSTTLADITGFNDLIEGAFTLYLKDTDLAGNVGTDSEVGVIKDTTAPVVAITSPVTGNTKNGTAVVTFTDGESTAPKLSINNTTFVDATSGVTTLADITGFSGLSDGAFTLYIKDTDAAGNTGTNTQAGIIKDATAPVVVLTAPVTGNNVKANKVITFTDDDSTTPMVSVDNTNWTAAVTGVTTLGDIAEFAGLGQTTFTLYLKDTDTIGNVGTTSQTGIIKDTVAPTVNILYPIAADEVKGTAILSFTDDEPTAPLVSIDNAVWVSAVSGVTTMTNITGFGALPEGNFTLYLKDTDLAGNTGTDSEVNVVKDTTAPIVNITAPVATDNVTAATAITFTDDGSSPMVSVDNTNWTAATSGVTILGDIAQYAGLSNGAFTLYLKDTDTAGNTGTDSEVGVIKTDA